MVSEDSIFNTDNLNNYSNVSKNKKQSIDKPRTMRNSKYNSVSQNSSKQKFDVLNNISKIDVNVSRVSSGSSSGKKNIFIKNNRFEKRPHYLTNRSNDSSLNFSRLPCNLSTNNLISNENFEESMISSRAEKFKMNLDNHVYGRKPPMLTKEDDGLKINKSYVKKKVQATSRLVMNDQENASRVRF